MRLGFEEDEDGDREWKVKLNDNEGFTLPSNIGELGDDITQLDLSNCSLQGLCCISSTQLETKPIAELSSHVPLAHRCGPARARAADEPQGAQSQQQRAT